MFTLLMQPAPGGQTLPTSQPMVDENNPLNWSWSKKHQVLLCLASASLLCDWGMTWGTTLFEAQAQAWHMTVPAVANSISGGIFMQGVGGILAVPIAQKYGRLPVLFWSQVLSCTVVIGAAFSSSFVGFTICRTLQGLFNTPPQVIGLSIIHDMFFFHERARKINLWAFSYLCGPFLGAFISALLIQKLSWRAIFGVLAGLHGLSILIVVILGDETLYEGNESQTRSANDANTQGKVHRLIGYRFVSGKRPTIRQCLVDIVRVGITPQLLLPTAVFTSIDFMWAIGIITTITQFVKPPPYLFSDLATALIYLAPFIGVVLAEIWGHFFNDFLQNRYMHRHNGVHHVENRLWAVYPATIISIIGLVLYGQTLQHQLHWIGLAIGWGLVAAGFLAATTAIEAYALDCFPNHTAIAASWVNFWRTTGGFCVSYFQLKWVVKNGAAITFGCQAAILAVASIAIVVTQILGGSWRERSSIQELNTAARGDDIRPVT